MGSGGGGGASGLPRHKRMATASLLPLTTYKCIVKMNGHLHFDIIILTQNHLFVMKVLLWHQHIVDRS